MWHTIYIFARGLILNWCSLALEPSLSSLPKASKKIKYEQNKFKKKKGDEERKKKKKKEGYTHLRQGSPDLLILSFGPSVAGNHFCGGGGDVLPL